MDIRIILTTYMAVTRMSTLGYCLYGSGDDCAFPCHCSDTSECGGPCTRGCKTTSGNLGTTWTGSTCQIGNVAQSKKANQTGDYGIDNVATKAVDGRYIDFRDCSHSSIAHVGNGQWWVDLGAVHKIYNITLYKRRHCCGYQSSYFTVGVIPDGGGAAVECGRYNQDGGTGGNVTIPCSTPLTGRYVHVARYGGVDKHILVMCEVIVIGHRYIDCSNIDCPTSCSDVTGCDRCFGSYPPYCNTPCESGLYGQNCVQMCGNCANGVTCDVKNGTCPGCATGYHGDKCDKTCGRCLNNTCAQNTAECPACELWWTDSKCNTEIVLPELQAERILDPIISNTSLTLKWQPLTSVPSNLSQYYQYTSKYRQKGDTDYKEGPSAIHVADNELKTTLEGLRHNTEYDVIIVPQRIMGGTAENNPGNMYGPVTVKTKCNRPILEDLVLSKQNRSGMFPSIEVAFQEQSQINHGCDNITDYSLRYKLSTAESYQIVSLGPSTTTYRISPSAWGEYILMVTVTNNQGLMGSSSGSIAISDDSRRPEEGSTNVTAIAVPIVLLVIAAAAIAVGVVFYGRRKRRQRPNELIGVNGQPLESHTTEKLNKAFENNGVSKEDLVTEVAEPSFKLEQYEDNANYEKVTPISTPGVTPTPSPKVRRPAIDPKPAAILSDSRDMNTLDKPKKSPRTTPSEGEEADEVLYENTGVDVKKFEEYTENRKRDSKDFLAEYKTLPQDNKSKCTMAQTDDNFPRNRFKNIFPYDNTRVKLAVKSADGSDYINANHITGFNRPKEYIATQGPLNTTAAEFWQMIWQERANRIVMVANQVENIKERCCQYWPLDVHTTTQFGSFDISTDVVEITADYTTTILSVRHGAEVRTVRHFHFTTWVDKNKPLYGATSLLAFHRKVHSFDDLKKGPMVVHCSAGVGRTGTFIVLDILMQQVIKERKVDVYGWVRSLRRERMMMVQTMEQYSYVHDVIVEFIKCGNTQIPCSDFEAQYLKLSGETGKSSRISEQFKILEKINKSEPAFGMMDVDQDHLQKSRNKDVIADSTDRPHLPGRQEDSFINAVFVDTFKFRDNIVVTQMPLPHTISDFWRLVHIQETKVIVMLNQFKEGDEPCLRYWPGAGGSEVYGDIEVTLTEEKEIKSSICTRTFSICKLFRKGRRSEPQLVRQFQLLTWPDDTVAPPAIGELLDLMDCIVQWKIDVNVKSTKTVGQNVVHCIDGVNHSGMYCAMTYMLDRMKLEQDVDPFLAARYVSRRRPEFFKTEEQYRFLYDIAMEYMSRYNEYANFQ